MNPTAKAAAGKDTLEGCGRRSAAGFPYSDYESQIKIAEVVQITDYADMAASLFNSPLFILSASLNSLYRLLLLHLRAEPMFAAQSNKTTDMKKFTLLLIVLSIVQIHQSFAQEMPQESMLKEMKSMTPKFGLKVGYNIASISGSTPNFTPKSSNGFTASVFYSPLTNGLGYRTELIFSRQGFSFDESGKMQNVSQDYIYMPQLTTFTIAKRVQLQAGGQIGYLLNTKKEAAGSETPTSGAGDEKKVMDFMNRIDYGATLGLEIYPFKGFIVGGRYNISLGNMYKQSENLSSPTATSVLGSFLPVNPTDFKGKNAVLQFSVGYRF